MAERSVSVWPLDGRAADLLSGGLLSHCSESAPGDYWCILSTDGWLLQANKSKKICGGSELFISPLQLVTKLNGYVFYKAMLSYSRYLYLPLFDAERCWSYAMQLKSEANTEPRKRFHMISRLKKAVVHADFLSTLCENEKCDARTKLEAQVNPYEHLFLNQCFITGCSIERRAPS